MGGECSNVRSLKWKNKKSEGVDREVKEREGISNDKPGVPIGDVLVDAGSRERITNR